MGMIALALLSAGCSSAPSAPRVSATATSRPTTAAMDSTTSLMESMDFVPPVTGFYAGDKILFIHTEASDPQVADMLTTMMGPQVVLVPRLAEIPEAHLAKVYVFTNGIRGDGPFGFQPDVFDAVPGDVGYSPLRAVNLVTWKEGIPTRELRSVEEVKVAESKGEVTIMRPGVVINIPILSWPGGHR